MKKKLVLILIVALIGVFIVSLSACNGSYVTITFESNGGTRVSDVAIDKNGNATLPENPTRDGYIFDGWYFDNGLWAEPCVGTEFKDKLSNFTVYAKWVMNGFNFTQVGNDYAIQKYQGKSSDVVIPTKYRNMPVSTIAKDAFVSNNSLLSVSIPQSITTVQAGAFNQCNSTVLLCEAKVKPVNWSEQWNIANRPVVWNSNQTNIADDGYTYFTADDGNRYGFSGSGAKFVRYMGNATTVTVPEKVSFGVNTYAVTMLDSFSFANCEKITKVNLPSSVSAINASAFSNCTLLQNFEITPSIKYIGEFAFYECASFTDIKIPATVNTIGSEAFSNCMSLILYCSASAKPSGWNVNWARNEELTKDNPVYWNMKNNVNFIVQDGMQFVIQNGKATLANYVGTKEHLDIPEKIFAGSVPYDVALIGSRALAMNAFVKTVSIPSSVSVIGEGAFSSCPMLTTVNLPASVTQIGASAFSNCSALLAVNIPASVTYIGSEPFAYSNKVVINCEVEKELGGWRFDWNYQNGKELTELKVNWGCDNITTNLDFDYVVHGESVYLTKYKGSATNVVVPNQIEHKDVVAFGNIFQENQTLQSIVIPDTILWIGDYAFFKCLSLTSVELPASIESIGQYAFAGSNDENMSLESIYLSHDIALETIGDYAFANCSQLSYFSMPTSTYKIGSNAFANCQSLANIVLRNSVTEIGESAFNNSTNLTIYCEMEKDSELVTHWSEYWSATIDSEKILWEINTNQGYVIDYYYQNIDNDDYTLMSEFRETRFGAVGSTASILAKNITHFTFVSDLSNTEGIIAVAVGEDGLVLKLYYSRNSYTITFSGAGGTFESGDEVQTVRFGGSVTPPVYTKTGYTLDGWLKSTDNISKTETINANWAPNTDTPYKVIYYLQNLEDDEYTLIETEDCIGTTAELVTITPKDYAHFTFNESESFISSLILADGSLVFEIYYTRDKYRISFNGDSGTTTDDESFELKYGAQILLPAYSKVGYTQSNWLVLESESWDLGFEKTADCDLTLKAVWTPNTDTPYKVSYYLQNLEDDDFTLDTTENFTGVSDEQITLSPHSVEHFTFDEDISFVQSNIFADGTLDLKVYYTRDKYTISFSGANGTTTDTQTFVLKYGAEIVAPNYIRAGYTQEGWQKLVNDSPELWDFETENIAETDLSIEPVWVADTDTSYKVEFYFENIVDSGFGLDETRTQNLNGTTDTLADATIVPVEHFTFNAEKSTQSGLVYDETLLTLSGNIDGEGGLVLRLYYARNIYTITFDGVKGTTTETETFELKYGAEIIAPEYERLGYTQNGWLKVLEDMSTEPWDIETENTAECDTSIQAVWVANTDTAYTVEFYFENARDSAYSIDETKTLNLTGTTDTIAEYEIPTIEHYNFIIGKSTANGVSYDSELSILSENISGDGTLVFKLYFDRRIYIVKFSANGGVHSLGFEEQYVKYGNDANNVNYTKAGYTQDGWTESLTNIDKDTDIMPVWIANDNEIVFIANGGAGTMEKAVIKTNESANLPKNTFTRAGYNFVGWAKVANGTKAYDDEALFAMGTVSKTNLYAIWTIITYNLTYTLNGGILASANPSTYTVASGEIVLNSPTLRGYTFGGWFDNAEFLGNAQNIIPSLSTGNKDLFAKWSANNYSISYELNGGVNNASNPASYTIENSNITLLAPTLEGCTFVGWYDSNGTTGNIVSIIKTSTLATYNLYAIWKTNQSGIDYVLSGDKATITGYTGEGGAITVLASLTLGNKTYTVKEISNYTFKDNTTITGITIKNGVLRIGDSAFENCLSLARITIPESITKIGAWAFYGCESLKSVTIPASVVEMGEWAFAYCPVLVAYCGASSIPEGWDMYWNQGTTLISHWNISASNFVDSNGLQFVLSGTNAIFARYVGNATSVKIPSEIPFAGVSYAVKDVAMWSFANCNNLVSISIPNSVVSIGSQALYGCSSLANLTIPFTGSKATATGRTGLFGYIFGWTVFSDSTKVTQVFGSKSKFDCYIPTTLTTVNVMNSTSLNYGAFSGCTMLTTVSLTTELTTIGDFAFSGCTALTALGISADNLLLASIGQYAFENCNALESIVVAENVAVIGEGAFKGCVLLTITCEMLESEMPIEWDDYWNVDNCEVVWATV